MKVGIITFHRALNYGAVLQTYALQQVVSNLGYECEVIDYRSNTIESLYYLSKSFLHNVKSMKIYPLIREKISFEIFLREKIKLGKSAHQGNDMKEIEEKYDILITGSDQVWCEKCLKKDKTFFLDFVQNKNKKYSYAASIGRDNLPEAEVEEFKKLLNSFSKISVREESGKCLVEKYTDKTVNVHVDPTLLLEKEQWNKLAKLKKPQENYILVYTVLEPYELINFAKKLSQNVNMPIIYLNDTMKKRQDNMIYKPAVAPDAYVGYFANASYVVTNSFHGTAFSLIYQKEFFVEFEAKGRRNIRAEELLGKLGIDNREITNINDLSNLPQTDWSAVEEKLQAERQKAKDYLQNLMI